MRVRIDVALVAVSLMLLAMCVRSSEVGATPGYSSSGAPAQTVRPRQQYLFVAVDSAPSFGGAGGVDIYRIGVRGLWHHIGATQGATCAVNFLTDPQADVFVAQCDNTVQEYAWPYTGAPIATIHLPGSGGTRALAMDRNDRLFLVNYPANFSGGGVYAFKPPYTGAPAAVFATDVTPGAIAVARNGTVFVSAFNVGRAGGRILEYVPPYTVGKPIVSYPAGFAALLSINPIIYGSALISRSALLLRRTRTRPSYV